jgi:hypothetical protein
MSGPFQTQVFNQPAQGVAGDFASTNPYFTYDAGPGGLVAGAAGVTIGNFAWVYAPLDPNSAPMVALSSGAGPVAGFVQRAQQGLNSTFLSDAGMTILSGLPVTVFTGGDFWVVNAGAAQAEIGQNAFANLATGAVSFAAAGSVPGGASGATSAIVSTTLTLVGGVSGNILSVASVSAGSVYNGAILNSNAAGSVVKQLTGSAHGAGTYLLSEGEQAVAAGTTIGGVYGVITFGTVTGGPFAIGMTLTGTAVVAGTVITDTITGGATSGTMVTNPNTAVSSTTIVGSSLVQTKWTAMSSGLTGELIKMSSQPTG